MKQRKHTDPFPTPPTPAHLDYPRGKTPIIEYFPMEVVPPSTACKHHEHGCEVCGTTDQRDALHTTRGGRGVVGRLKRSRAK